MDFAKACLNAVKEIAAVPSSKFASDFFCPSVSAYVLTDGHRSHFMRLSRRDRGDLITKIPLIPSHTVQLLLYQTHDFGEDAKLWYDIRQ